MAAVVPVAELLAEARVGSSNKSELNSSSMAQSSKGRLGCNSVEVTDFSCISMFSVSVTVTSW